MNDQFYYIQDRQQIGPVSLQELIRAGITLDTQIWTSGMSDWQPARNVPQVASLLNPPIPTSGASSPYTNSHQTYTPSGAPSQMSTEPCPPTYLIWSILVTLFCCWPLGIPAIINASQVESAYNKGEIELAKKRSKNALNYLIASAIIGVVASLAYLGMIIFSIVLERLPL